MSEWKVGVMSEWKVGQRVIIVGRHRNILGEAVVERAGKASVWTSNGRRWTIHGMEWGLRFGERIVAAGTPAARQCEMEAAGAWRLADYRALAATARQKARMADYDAEKAEERLADLEARLAALRAKHAAEEAES
jgi:hypothetical protein